MRTAAVVFSCFLLGLLLALATRYAWATSCLLREQTDLHFRSTESDVPDAPQTDLEQALAQDGILRPGLDGVGGSISLAEGEVRITW